MDLSNLTSCMFPSIIESIIGTWYIVSSIYPDKAGDGVMSTLSFVAVNQNVHYRSRGLLSGN